jgi:hypothetical protein
MKLISLHHKHLVVQARRHHRNGSYDVGNSGGRPAKQIREPRPDDPVPWELLEFERKAPEHRLLHRKRGHTFRNRTLKQSSRFSGPNGGREVRGHLSHDEHQ